MTDADLIAACRQGSVRAQKQLYEQFSGMMFGVCLRYLRRREDAEEVMLGGFAKVFRALDQYRHEGSFEGWIRRIMVNEALGQLRRKEPLHLAIDDSHTELAVTPAEAESQLNAADLLALLAELPAGYRTVFNMYAVEGFSHAEIAGMLGISEGTSKSQLSKARAMLQRRLAAASLSASPTPEPKEYYATGRY
ncbi:RNA polymerase sigma-70 factor, ECF subfamily [Hymenobacter daecheongensis DSM 21074]|uniref:RNA polymerase sigma-70 factor, ECF subfamily n=1 Tax=Hymenobacter daecheongensis DSM 21074 TaxID=1121955 RepID=A0A1M6JX57_9BACT|nr:sigma-70 family RNA polymerase sigma factor [Hymenobacter daecheongensis]SHJ51238.1 RNA polymerase sigma-70 factor, ECF subfamily [Hymenobacter daecheongensis DSM 21074]